MASIHTHHGADEDGADRLGGTLYWLAFGGIIGAVALTLDLTADAFAIGIAQAIFDLDLCTGSLGAPQYALMGVAVASSFAIAFSLWHMRLNVGAKAGPEDQRWALHLRRCFTLASLGIFAVATPVKWLLILGFVSC